MTAIVGAVIRTDVELFDLPEGAVIRTPGPNPRIGEVCEPRDEDAPAWAFEDGGRTLPRHVDWTGTDIPSYPHDSPVMLSWIFPATVIYPGQCTDLTKAPRGNLRCILSAGHDADPRSLHWVDPAGPVES